MPRDFPTNSDYLWIWPTGGAALNGSAGTLAFWFKPHWAYNDSTIHVFLSFTVDASHQVLFWKNSDNLFYIGWFPGSWYIASAAASGIVQEDWNLLAYTYKTATPAASTAYLNNSQIGTGGCSTWDTTAGSIVVGQYTPHAYTANAAMAKLMHWSRILDSTELASIYNDQELDPTTIDDLVFYYPIGAGNPDPDLMGGPSLSIVGSPSVVEGPGEVPAAGSPVTESAVTHSVVFSSVVVR